MAAFGSSRQMLNKFYNMTILKSAKIFLISFFPLLGMCQANLSSSFQSESALNIQENIHVMIRSVKYNFEKKEII